MRYDADMRIAVIGSGVSGLTSALIAAPHAEVTLYESDSRLGGHADTQTILVGGRDIQVDTGFMVFNPPRYPTLMALFDFLKIPHLDTQMSFSVSIKDTLEYSSRFPGGIFADYRGWSSLRYYRFLFDILRFNGLAQKALSTGTTPANLGTFLDTHGFCPELAEWYLFPMLGAIWSCSTSTLRDFPAEATFRFLDNHQLLSATSRPRWHTIPGGSIRYVDAIKAKLREYNARIIVNARITHIDRAEQVIVHTHDSHEIYDYVIMATHADTTLSLIAAPTIQEREILGAFTYSDNVAILHCDSSLMPQHRAAWASWNYTADPHSSAQDTISVTYDMNALQHIPHNTPVYVSLNPRAPIASDKIYKTLQYTHPHFSVKTTHAQNRLPEIQGKNKTLFTGAHWGYGFHEDGALSALQALATLGIIPPWNTQ